MSIHDEHGFSIAEALVGLTMSLLVMFGMLQTFDTFKRSSAQQERLTDAADEARRTVDRIIAEVRDATTVEIATPTDVVYMTSRNGTATRARICLDGDGTLWQSLSGVATSAGAACPGPNASRIIGHTVSDEVFSYDSTTPAMVKSVGVRLTVDASGAGKTQSTTLRSAAFLRTRMEVSPPVSNRDVSAVCNTNGQGLTLTLGVTADDSGPLTIVWKDSNGQTLGSGPTVSFNNDGEHPVTAVVTNVLGGVTTLVIDPEC